MSFVHTVTCYRHVYLQIKGMFCAKRLNVMVENQAPADSSLSEHFVHTVSCLRHLF